MRGIDNFEKCLLDVMHVCGQTQTQNFHCWGGGQRADPEAICNWNYICATLVLKGCNTWKNIQFVSK
jgi:hypothetical protein